MGRPGLRNHPKFQRLMLMLGEPEAHVRGYLECLWDVAYECGNPEIGDATDMQLACKGMQNDAQMQKFLDALLHCGGSGRSGFIEIVPDSEPLRYVIHDLFDHAPDYVQKRAGREGERQAKGLTISEVRRKAAMVRWDKRNANVMQTPPFASCLDANVCTPTPAPAPSPTPKSVSTHNADGVSVCTHGFFEFWKSWPDHERKNDEEGCLRLWNKLGLDGSPEVVASLKAWKESDAWVKDGGRYIPYPINWLKKKQWKTRPTIKPTEVKTGTSLALANIEKELNGNSRFSAGDENAGHSVSKNNGRP